MISGFRITRDHGSRAMPGRLSRSGKQVWVVAAIVALGLGVGWVIELRRPKPIPVPEVAIGNPGPAPSKVNELLAQARELQRAGKFQESEDFITVAIKQSGFNENDLPACLEQRADLWAEWRSKEFPNTPEIFRQKARDLREQYKGRK